MTPKRPMIYLDHAATSWPKPDCVAREMTRFLAEDAGNPGRSGHRMAVLAQRVLDELRSMLTRFFDGDDPNRLIFCLNASDALNMAIKGAVREGDHVVATMLEHNSVSRPLRAMADRGFITLTRVPMVTGGFVDPDDIRKALRPNTRLAACLHASNVIGTIQPIAEMGRIVREHGALFLVDAAQTAGVVPISAKRMGIDLLAFPGHKSLLGPAGTGGLMVSSRADLRPWREGGTGGDSDSPTQPTDYPYWLEAGTPNTVGLAGLRASVEQLMAGDPLAHLRLEQTLVGRLAETLADDPRVTILGDPDPAKRVGTLSVTLAGWDPAEMTAILDESFNIAVRGGLHCAPYIHRALGSHPAGGVRASVGPFNTTEHIDQFTAALKQIADSVP